MTTMLRPAEDADGDRVAEIWEHGWRQAHLGRVPDALVQVRTHGTFVSRARANIPRTTVATVDGAVAGFVVVVGDELEQIYVDASHRGSGVAAALLRSAEQTVAAAGYPAAWLAVVADNETARRFYARNGWADGGSFTYRAATQVGPVDVPCRRYTKTVLATGAGTSRAVAWWRRVTGEDGLVLRAPVEADADGVLAVHGDPLVYELDPHEVHADLEYSRAFLAPVLEHWSRSGFGYWSVLVPTPWWPEGPAGAGAGDGDRAFVGLGGVRHHVLAGAPVLNVYFRLAPAVHGRGISGRILRTAIALRDEVAPTVDLVVRTRPANTVARRVALRAGFVDEGLEPGDPTMQLLRLPGAP